MIIDDRIIAQVGETAYATWKDAALATLSDLICMNDFEQSQTDMNRQPRRQTRPPTIMVFGNMVS